MIDMIREATYRSIFLADNWAHQAYLGWRVVVEQPGLRILRKRRSVVNRYLVLLTRDGKGQLGGHVHNLISLTGLYDLIIHDFDRVLGDEPLVAGRQFRIAERLERLLNIATFVIDLSQDEATLLARMNSDYRRKIRLAGSNGITVEAFTRPDSMLLNRFIEAFNNFAKERRLNSIDSHALHAMYRDGRGLLLVARKKGELSNFLHLYRIFDSASFMYGINLLKANDGAGQFLHFEAMRLLRQDGVRWYDLGGVASANSSDGIFNFKQKFGGEFVDLGLEWRCTGFGARVAVGSIRALKRVSSRRIT